MRRELRQVLFPDKNFWARMLSFSIPIALQNLSIGLLAVVDVALLSGMGENAVAAVSLANQVTYVTGLIAFGISSGAAIFLSRGFGAEDSKTVKKNFILMLFCSFLINLMVAVISFFAPQRVLALYTNKEQLIVLGSQYLVIVAPSFVLYGISNAMTSFFRSGNQPAKPMIVSLVMILTKTSFNFLLIYGCGPVPALGIIGAAVATLISRIVELMINVIMLLRFEKKEYVFQLCDFQYINGKNLKYFLKNTCPVILNESLWGIGLSAFSAIFGRMGAMELSALSVAQQLENLCNSFFYGIGVGACVTIGYMIGEKDYDRAKLAARQYAVSGFYVGAGIMVLMLGLDMFYVNGFFSGLMEETRRTAMILIGIYAIYMPFRSFASSMIMGSLRAGGDSRRAMCYDVLPVYLWSLPIGFLTGSVFHWNIAMVLLAMQFKRVIKSGFALRRLRSDRWLSTEPIE